MNRVHTAAVVIMTAASYMGTALPAAAAAADTTASFSIAAPTEVPGAVLKPGQYTIQLVDHLSDRAILRLDSVSGSTHLTFLGVNTSGVNASGGSNEPAHPVQWPEKAAGKHALRGFTFQNGRNVEFVYPKADAVALANANGAGVVAIDPASEGRPELSKLTNVDMQLVNLWMLTPVRVGPGGGTQKGIEAKRYQQQAAASVQVAQGPRLSPAAPASNALVAGVQAPPRPVVHRTAHVSQQLPKTGSDLPLLWVCGVLSFTGAGLMRWRARQA